MEKKVVNGKVNRILEKIIARRNEIGITQWELATILNITNNGYFKVEKGMTKLDVKRLIEIAEILNISPAYFLEDL